MDVPREIRVGPETATVLRARRARIDKLALLNPAKFLELEQHASDTQTGFYAPRRPPSGTLLSDRRRGGFDGSVSWPFDFARAIRDPEHLRDLMDATTDPSYHPQWRAAATEMLMAVHNRVAQLKAAYVELEAFALAEEAEMEEEEALIRAAEEAEAAHKKNRKK